MAASLGETMLTLLLVIIYLSFISLGLPDSLLGAAWPAMHGDLGVSVSLAGILSMIVSCGTVISSLMSTRLIKRFGTGMVTAVSVAMTAAALVGFGASKSFAFLCLLSIPLGLGAGSVDAALNNFVALHFKAKHMNWLHCFWGIGATAGPVIMSFWLAKSANWNMGYSTIGLIQAVLAVGLFFSLPLWKKVVAQKREGSGQEVVALGLRKVLSLRHAKPVLLSLFCYCALELTVGLWGGSYAVAAYGVMPDTAAGWTSVYYLGITLGRLVAGFVSMRLSNKRLIRAGQACVLSAIVLLFIPSGVWKIPLSLGLAGLGCAPIYPCMLHETPKTFGSEVSQSIMGVQMACAYVGSTFMPPLFGVLARAAGIGWFPAYLLLFIIVMAICTESVNVGRMRKAE